LAESKSVIPVRLHRAPLQPNSNPALLSESELLSQEEEFDGADLSIHKIGATPDREVNW